MTDNTQPEALRLADQLRALSFGGTCILAADELRRQHAENTTLQRGYDEALRERDDAEDFIDALLDEVLGHERPEWSSSYGRADALNDVQERMTALHKPAVDKAWGRFQSAMAAPKQEAQEPVAWQGVHDQTDLYYTKPLQADVRPLYAAPQPAPAAQGDARVQGLIAAADYIDGPASGYAAEHSYTEPSPMAKVAAALRQKAEQEDAAYQARRSDQGLMESEWGPMEDAPPHEDPPMHVAVVEGDDAVRTLQWNRDVAAFAYPVGTLLYAARSQAKEGA